MLNDHTGIISEFFNIFFCYYYNIKGKANTDEIPVNRMGSVAPMCAGRDNDKEIDVAVSY